MESGKGLGWAICPLSPFFVPNEDGAGTVKGHTTGEAKCSFWGERLGMIQASPLPPIFLPIFSLTPSAAWAPSVMARKTEFCLSE